MANSYQVRASVAAWLGGILPLAAGITPSDRVAHQSHQGWQSNEWRVSWGKEIKGDVDQGFNRLLQIDRYRNDGDEIALEKELVAALTAMGLDKPADVQSVTIYNYPASSVTAIGTATVSRLDDDGWDFLPDPEGREGYLRATLTLKVLYG